MTDLEFRRTTPSGRHPWAVNDRDHAARRARLETGCPDLLRLDVDFGLSVVQQAFELRSKRPTIASMAVTLLFHRVVELVDSVDVLLSAGAGLPARHMTRVMAEAAIYVRWLAMVDDDSVAAVYLSTSQNETMRRSAVFHRGIDTTALRDRLDRESAFLDTLGGGVSWRKVLLEVVRLARERADWFSAFDGPRSFADMIRALKDESSVDVGFLMDQFALTGRSLDWAQSVNFEEHAIPGAVSGMLHPLRDVRFYSDSIAFICHGAFVGALHAVVEYFGGEMEGAEEWSIAADRIFDEAEQ